ncbi:Nucleoside-diphosphate-sugar epimerase [Kosakonia radicincitans]|uniref:NAD-dependent epimerase/dehydratase family protein n=1 Tax=Kosakonia radicincitans TaxID=283686 RepID=UPI0009A5AA74|nr:NAD-dependent epimerase/dehydratase family protein [Kosakonia radicincitans]SKC18991.1 Nucleoside-diphosphate-sugar epimerase [Kosakonia radicincitans]
MTSIVAVTGATGFIGQHIVRDLLSHGFSVRALTRNANRPPRENVTWIQGSLDDREALAGLLNGADYVVHCAGQVRGHTEDVFTHCNVTGSLRLMQVARQMGRCKRFLFISSLAARHPELSWYANSKFVAEQRLIEMAASHIALGIFRPTAVYGPGDKELKPLFDWLLRGLLPQLGAPEARLSFLHVSDLAQAVSQWLLTEKPRTACYELCDGLAGGYSWQRIREIGARVRNGRVRLIPVPLLLLKRLSDISVLGNRLARKEPMLTHSKLRELTHPDWSASNKSLSESINWFPKISLEQALFEGLF